jgi:hypothetical protein
MGKSMVTDQCCPNITKPIHFSISDLKRFHKSFHGIVTDDKPVEGMGGQQGMQLSQGIPRATDSLVAFTVNDLQSQGKV